jgi:uncharacterized protein YbjT (DUF2867 family)
MTFIIHGATGAQGAPVLTALQTLGHSGVAAVRDGSRVNGPAASVDYSSRDSLVAAYQGAEGVFVHLPLGRPEEQISFAQTIGEAVRRARPARVVFSTSGYTVGDVGDGVDGANMLFRELEDSGVSYAVVEPRLYLENLLMPALLRPAMQDGVLRYPLREDYATSWSSHLDVADVVAHLLADHDVTGIVSVGALPGLIGEDLAEGFSRYFNKTVRFEAIEPEEFGRLITPVLGEAAVAPVVQSYKYRQGRTGEFIPEERSAQKLLAMHPRSVEQWLRDANI